MSDTILAIDLGKFNSVLCWYEPGGRVAEFRTVRPLGPSATPRRLASHPRPAYALVAGPVHRHPDPGELSRAIPGPLRRRSARLATRRVKGDRTSKERDVALTCSGCRRRLYE